MCRFCEYAFGALAIGFVVGFLGAFALDLGFDASRIEWWRGFAVGSYTMFASFRLTLLKP